MMDHIWLKAIPPRLPAQRVTLLSSDGDRILYLIKPEDQVASDGNGFGECNASHIDTELGTW